MVIDISELSYGKAETVKTNWNLLVLVMVWLFLSVGLGQVTMSNWLFNPTISVQQSTLQLPHYQKVESLREVNCLEGDCDFEARRQKISRQAFEKLVPNFERIYLNVQSKIDPNGNSSAEGYINYLGKEHFGDQKAYFYSDQVNNPAGYRFRSSQVKDNQVTIVFKRNVAANLAWTFVIVLTSGIMILGFYFFK